MKRHFNQLFIHRLPNPLSLQYCSYVYYSILSSFRLLSLLVSYLFSTLQIHTLCKKEFLIFYFLDIISHSYHLSLSISDNFYKLELENPEIL